MAADHLTAGASGPSSTMSSLLEGALLAARSWSAGWSTSTPHFSPVASAIPPCGAASSSSSLPSLDALPNATCPSSPPAHSVPPEAQGLVSGPVFAALSFLGVDMHPPSAITGAWPGVASPAPVVCSVLLYLLAVAAWSHWTRTRGLRPQSQDPPALKALVVAHNAFLCGLSLYMGSGLAWEAYRSGYSVWGNKCTDNNPRLAFYVYLFYVSKVYEFVDTAIMLLKRNLRQVSYLHVYHHATIAVIWWILCFRCPVGDTYFSAAFNSWIHVIMYSYYLLAAAIGKDERRRKKYLFWGKYLTMLQIAQFVSFMGQAVYLQVMNFLTPGFSPDGIPRLLFFYSLSLLLFFLDFFVKKHIMGCRSKKTEAVTKKD